MTDWENWIAQTRANLLNLPYVAADVETRNFLASYRLHLPTIVRLPAWPAFDWTLDTLRAKVGGRQVQVQVNRNSSPDYEFYPDQHRGKMPCNQFLDLMESSSANEYYMTAQNSHEHTDMTASLAEDMRPMPGYLIDNPYAAFLWIGKDTVTPLHHDVTNNIMCQIMGRKNIRMVAPEHWQKLDHRHGVHTNITWVDESHGVPFYDFWIGPGEALFLPVGWFHCVKAVGISATAVFTNFIWPNDAHQSFIPIAKKDGPN